MSDYVTGFMDVAKKYGISEKQAMFSLKAAASADPAIAAQAGLSQQPPADLGSGQPPLPGDQGIPPELEELINSLPPEVLEQLLAEVQAELSGGEGQQKQASFSGDMILAKTAEYQEGFLQAAKDNRIDMSLTELMYKRALDEMEASPIDLSLQPDTPEKRASHAEGVISAAVEYGLSKKEAIDLYTATFLN